MVAISNLEHVKAPVFLLAAIIIILMIVIMLVWPVVQAAILVMALIRKTVPLVKVLPVIHTY
jgi:hypothetical protein